jgi:hypothetical protein
VFKSKNANRDYDDDDDDDDDSSNSTDKQTTLSQQKPNMGERTNPVR